VRSLRALLGDLVDYAGLFPPAALGMDAAANRYASYLEGSFAWMLGRFIVPVSRLVELEDVARTWWRGNTAGQPWRLSGLVGSDVPGDLSCVARFNERYAEAGAGRVTIDTVEVKVAGQEGVREAARLVPPGVRLACEVPCSADLIPLLATVRDAGGVAKARLGGVTADAIPTPEDVAGFIGNCLTVGVSFKATAGLHHPIRGCYRLTYEPDSPTAVMHGFLNVFVAACAAPALGESASARGGRLAGTLAAILADTDPAAFRFGDSHVAWRDLVLDAASLDRARREFALSFGSCSFEEPVGDLTRTVPGFRFL
jgi:hypothetical protein